MVEESWSLVGGFVALCAWLGPKKNEIAMGSFALSVPVAVFMLWVSPRVVPGERWPLRFGSIYAILATMYLLRVVAPSLLASVGLQEAQSEAILEMLMFSGSAATNLLLFSVARSLLHLRSGVPQSLAVITLGLVGVFVGAKLPPLLGVEVIPSFSIALRQLSELGDGAISALCLGWCAVALFRNLRFGRRLTPLGWLAVLSAALYAISVLVNGGMSILLEGWAGRAPLMPSLAPALARAEVVPAHVHLPFQAVALLLKVPLFLGVLDLLVQRIRVLVPEGTAPEAGHGSGVAPLTEAARDGVSLLHATVTLVLVRLPGDDSAALAFWATPQGAGESSLNDLSPDNSIGALCMSERRTLASPDWRDEPALARRYRPSMAGVPDRKEMVSLVATPVLFQGQVVGALVVEWEDAAAFGPATVRAAEQIARQIAGPAQARREIEALRLFGAGVQEAARRGAERGIDHAVTEACTVLEKVLSPSHVHVRMRAGFYPPRLLGSARESTRSQPTAAHYELRSGSLHIGTLWVTGIPSGFSPTVMEAMAGRMADAIITAGMGVVARRLAELQVRIAGVNTTCGLMETIDDLVREVGVRWTVLYPAPGLDGSWGRDRAHTDAITRLDRDLDPIERHTELTPLAVLWLPEPVDDCAQVLRARIPGTGMGIWFGIANPSFGAELAEASPWRLFVDRLAEVAAASFHQLTARAEIEQAQFDAAQTQGLATVAAMTGTLIHQIANLNQDLSYGAHALYEGLQSGRVQVANDRLRGIIESTNRSSRTLNTLTDGILALTRLDARRPSSLRDALAQTRRIFDASFFQRKISFDLPDELLRGDELLVDVPFHVLVLAISNLVSNAKDALRDRGGRIWVEMERQDEMVIVRIIDDGPGVREDIRDRIMDLGVTTKARSGGWGLYLTQRTLRENRSSLELTRTSPDGTTFTLTFPSHNIT